MAREVVKEIGNKSREFYEFVLPPVDMYLDDENLTVIIDIPGFEKNDIKLTVNGDILSIFAAKKDNTNSQATVIWKQRPKKIDKKIKLPINTKKDDLNGGSAKYEQGVLTVKIPAVGNGKKIIIE